MMPPARRRATNGRARKKRRKKTNNMEGRTQEQLNPSWKASKKVLDREEHRLGKIADRNTSVIRSIKTKALKNKNK